MQVGSFLCCAVRTLYCMIRSFRQVTKDDKSIEYGFQYYDSSNVRLDTP